MSWDTNTESDQRSYNIVPASLDVSGGDFNTLLGLIFAASCFPEPKKLFPEQGGLEGGRYLQSMRQAQVPLLVLMQRNRILNSPFFRAAEAYVGVPP